MGVSIDQITNDGYFPTQKDHLHLLEGVSKHICSDTIPYYDLAGENSHYTQSYVSLYLMIVSWCICCAGSFLV